MGRLDESNSEGRPNALVLTCFQGVQIPAVTSGLGYWVVPVSIGFICPIGCVRNVLQSNPIPKNSTISRKKTSVILWRDDIPERVVWQKM